MTGGKLAQIHYYFAKAPMLAEAALVVMMAWMIAGWLMPTEQWEDLDGSKQSQAAVMTLPALADLLAVPLFGKLAPQVKPQAKAQPKPVVQSPLNVKLLGTVVAGDASAAIIKLAGNPDENVFFIGDTIQQGATLKEVEASTIIIDHNGILERISMDEGVPLTQVALPVMPAAPQIQASRSMSRALLNRQMQDLPRLLTQARVMPNMVNGRGDGFVIADIVPGSLYQQAGLQNGDVLRKVNGQVISNPGQAMQLYQTLQNAPAIDLELTRAGQLQQLHYDIR